MTQRRGRWRWVLAILLVLAIGRGMSGLIAGAAQAEALGVRPSWRLLSVMDLSLRVMVALVAIGILAANLLPVRHSIVTVVLQRRIGNLQIGEAIPLRALTIGAVVIAIVIGALFATVDLDASRILLALHGVRFGATDPYLERDLGWYLVRLPVERSLWETAVTIVSVAAMVTLALYAGTPSLRVREGRVIVTGWVRRHLGVLGAVGLLLVAWHWRLARFELLVTGSGASAGFGAVDHRLLLPYLLMLAIATVGCAVLFLGAVWQGATRLAIGVAATVLILGPLGRLALVAVGPSLGATTRAVREREVAYDATRARYTALAHGDVASRAAPPALSPDSVLRLTPPGAIIRPDGGRYRVVRDTTGRVAAPSLTTWGERITQAWALQNPRLALDGGASEDRLLIDADPWARVRRVAPFLRTAPSLHLVRAGDAVLWVVDLEVEGEWYPLAAPVADRAAVVRYRRPAGIALVDAMTGGVRLIPPEDPDPILRAWMALVPDVFAAGASVAPGLEAAAVRAARQGRLAPQDSLASGLDATRVPTTDLRAEAAALYDAMEAARRAGDWAAYGAAWRRLGVLLGRPAP